MPILTDPVGLSFALAGYSVAVIVARAFVSLIAHCTQACPSIRIEGFQFHHLYYGIALVVISLAALGVLQGSMTRWDAALVLGIGTGLFFDEVGLVLLRVPYWSPTSLLFGIVPGLVISLTVVHTLRLQGLSNFRVLDGSDLLTLLSVLLGLIGFLFFARPVTVYVTAASVGSWASAVVLMGVYGRRHLLKILQG